MPVSLLVLEAAAVGASSDSRPPRQQEMIPMDWRVEAVVVPMVADHHWGPISGYRQSPGPVVRSRISR